MSNVTAAKRVTVFQGVPSGSLATTEESDVLCTSRREGNAEHVVNGREEPTLLFYELDWG